MNGVQFSYGKGNASHHLCCDSSHRRSYLLGLSTVQPDGLGSVLGRLAARRQPNPTRADLEVIDA
jgi:hypothetical protein